MLSVYLHRGSLVLSFVFFVDVGDIAVCLELHFFKQKHELEKRRRGVLLPLNWLSSCQLHLACSIPPPS